MPVFFSRWWNDGKVGLCNDKGGVRDREESVTRCEWDGSCRIFSNDINFPKKACRQLYRKLWHNQGRFRQQGRLRQHHF